ncbi:MAG TPA: hypothetical protein VEH10_04805 [Thermoplasmata archaeon]|nr:hypothetical protein [Thermoplasmata archaeon]
MPPNLSPVRHRAESILVHGSDELAIAAVAVALALRATESFAWADCADPGVPSAGDSARSWVEARSGRPAVDPVEESLLRPSNSDRQVLRQLVAPAQGLDEARLLNHLALPELFQRLAARAISSDGHGVVLLANVDALSATLRAETLEAARLHQTLHDEGLTMIVTSRAPPSEAMVRTFDRIFRVDVPSNRSWEAGSLTEVKSAAHERDGPPVPLLTALGRLGLDPDRSVPR